MPSYRIVLTVGDMLPGASPATLAPACASRARESTTVEALDVRVRSGQPQVVLRVTASDDIEASAVCHSVHEAASAMAHIHGVSLLRRTGGTWTPRPVQ